MSDIYTGQNFQELISTAKRTNSAVRGLFDKLTMPTLMVTDAILRKDMGGRYVLQAYTVGGGVLIVAAGLAQWWIKAHGDRLTWDFRVPPIDYFAVVVGLAWLIAYIWGARDSLRAFRKRIRDKVRWHSYYPGDWRIPIIPDRLQRVVPLVVAALLALMGQYGYAVLLALSTWVAFAADNARLKRATEAVLDAIDGQIEGENLQKALGQYPGQQTEGYVLPLNKDVSELAVRSFFNQPADPVAKGRPAPVPTTSAA